MTATPLATGRVEALAINGQSLNGLHFSPVGPHGDRHHGYTRALSGHDGEYLRTSSLQKGATVFNWRSWTALSTEEVGAIEGELGVSVPVGCLLENLRISGIPNFSKLAPTTRLVFPKHSETQLILAVWEENGPCGTVGRRLAEHHAMPDLKTNFIRAAQHRRGVMGFVLAMGSILVGDTVLVYPPVQ